MLNRHFAQWVLIACICMPFCAPAISGQMPFTVVVTQAYIDVRTGPAKTYPSFYVAQRNQQLQILKRKTHWLKVELADSHNRVIDGWVHRDQIADTRVLYSEKLAKEHPRFQHNHKPLFSGTFSLGRLENADSISVNLGYHGLKRLVGEIDINSYTGTDESGLSIKGQLLYEPYYQWRVSPFVNAGYGYLRRDQDRIRQRDKSDNFLNAGMGIKWKIHPLYRLRFEYQIFNTLTSTDDNRELEVWQIGLTTYF